MRRYFTSGHHPSANGRWNGSTVPSYVLQLRAGQLVKGDQPDRYGCAANVSRLSTQVPFINKCIYQRLRRTRSVKSPRILSRAKSLWCRKWWPLECLGARRETRGNQGGVQDPAFVLYFRSPVHGCKDTFQPEINLNPLTATWSTNHTGFRPITRKELRMLALGPIRPLPPPSLPRWPHKHTAAHGQQPG